MTNQTNDVPLRLVHVGEQRIPIVSLKQAFSSVLNDRESVANALAEACREFGFFYIEHHSISSDFLGVAERAMKDFFLLPDSAKKAIHISKSLYHRGYFSSGEENAYGSTIMDVKEAFDMALELPMDDPFVVAGKPFHGPNAWPAEQPGFKRELLHLYEEWRRVCAQISSLFALKWGLPETYFVDKTDKPLCQLRVAKYPPTPGVSAADPIGCGAHTDYGIVSVIWQMDVPGLQIKNRKGDWIDAPAIPGTFVCPVGDATEILTNGDWQATVHRVINSTPSMRHSSAFFFDPNYDCVVSPLPQFVGRSVPRYAATTMGAHVARGFNGTFAYRTQLSQEAV